LSDLLQSGAMQRTLRDASHLAVESVTELSRRLRFRLETDFRDVWVSGEISNLRTPGSGHLYFRLKDAESQIAAVMFRSAARQLAFRLEDGLEVVVHGRVSLYEPRGDLQLYADGVEPRGVGAAQLALEQLKRRLAAEGLFDAARKRPLPFWPRAVGVVTALGGAAIHDIVATLRSRLGGVRIVVRPVRVQGPQAGFEIVAALAELAAVREVDVVIVGRGGGSLEDLWAFNEESVARAIAGSRAPVISAVGHEIDVTLADLVADQRAATPTAAAAMAVPRGADLSRTVDDLRLALSAALAASIERRRERVTALGRHLRDPRQLLVEQRRRLVELTERGARSIKAALRMRREDLRRNSERLDALSPLAVLQRGYAIVQRPASAEVVRRAADVAPAEELRVTLAEGSLRVRVEGSRG
jgi:exodeoxyribonuclease VII large subunit